jgi:hypothetical protein
MALVKCNNSEHEDLMLLAKYQYGQINNLTMLPALRFVMCQHLWLDPYNTGLLTLGAITNKLTRAVMSFYGDELLTMHGGSFLPNLLEKFAKEPLNGIHELFHALTMLQMKDGDTVLRPCPRPQEELREALEAYLIRREWLQNLRLGSEVIWKREGEQPERYRVTGKPPGFRPAEKDDENKFQLDSGPNTDTFEVPASELQPVIETADVSNS